MMGLRTLDQRVVMAPRFALIGSVEEGIASYSDGEKWGYLRDGKPITPAIYDAAWPVDLPQGIALLTKAADAGNAEGLASLGDCHAHGTGVAKDPAKALALYRRAADLGEPQAWIGLAELHEEGAGVVKSFAEAEKWYRKALGTAWDEVAREGLKRLGARP